MSMTLITTATIGASGPSSIDFNNIPANFTDLRLFMSLRDSSSTGIFTYFGVTVNANNSSIYNQRVFYNTPQDYPNPVSQNSVNQANIYYGRIPSNYSTFTTNSFSSIEAYFPNYSGILNKTWSLDIASDNNSSTYWTLSITANGWASSTPITSISIWNAGGNWAQYSSVSLYGINKGSGGAVVTA